MRIRMKGVTQMEIVPGNPYKRIARVSSHLNPLSSDSTFESSSLRRWLVTSAVSRVPDGCAGSVQKVEEGPSKRVILVVGAGDGTGGAVAKRFAREGYTACVVRRNREKLLPLVDEIRLAGGEAIAFGGDARSEDDMVVLVEKIEREVGQIIVAVFNIGANVKFSILETSARVYFKVWQMACFAGFVTGREVAKRMVTRNVGTIIFTGATASVRGASGFAAFSGAKFALRSLAQSMARELGPKGVHVAHVIIDGAIDGSWIRANLDGASELASADGLLPPDAIAEVYWQLHLQSKGAWSHEMDLRPWIEAW